MSARPDDHAYDDATTSRETGNVWFCEPEPTSMDAIYYWACVLVFAASVAVAGGIAGYVYVKFYPALEQAFWAWAALYF